MDFQERLQKAIQRGQLSSDAAARQRAEAQLSAEEFKRLHTKYRLELSEHIDECLKQLPRHFPGFRHESVVGSKGWGGAVKRDDLSLAAGRRENFYSRLELVVRPFSRWHVLELVAKGTIRNKEIFNRSQYQTLDQVDIASFRELIDRWILEYAELYAAKS